MQVRFRLAEILDEFRDSGRGTIKKIVEETGLERHQVSALLKNEVQYLSLNSLGAVCDYLINTHHMDPHELPGRLFALEPEDFWAFLSERQSLVISFGVRHEMHDADLLWIPAADSFLQGMLLNELYGTEAPSRDSATVAVESRPEQTRVEPGSRFGQYMVRSCSAQPNQDSQTRDAELQQMQHEAIQAYARFEAIAGNKALVCLGSVKSNGLCELAVSRVFSTVPWASQDEVHEPSQRSCPFFLQYRERDANVPSCQGGRRLAKNLTDEHLSVAEAGIYYESKPNQWAGIPSHEDREPALVFYSFRPPTGVVEVVLGGFSTVGTFLLAQHFRKIVREIWPPTFVSPELEVGAFLVDFQLKPKTPSGKNTIQTSQLGSSVRDVENLEIIRLPESVLKPRLVKTSGQQKK